MPAFLPVRGCSFLKKHPKTNIYYVRKYVAGKGELFKSTRTSKVGLAKTIADQMIHDFIDIDPGLKNKRVKVKDICSLLLSDFEKATKEADKEGLPIRRKSTFDSKDKPYLRGPFPKEYKLKKGMRKQGVIRDLFGEMFIDEIDEVFMKKWIKKEGKKHTKKFSEIIKYLGLALSYAHESKYISRRPKLKNPDRHVKKAIRINDADAIRFFESAEPDLKDLIIIGSENPLRPHENCEIEWSMVKTEGKIVEYVLPESLVKKNARTIRLTPNAAKVVLRRLKKRNIFPVSRRSPFVFPSVRDINKPLGCVHRCRMWNRMKAKAGIPSDFAIHFHWFRHNVYRRLLKVHNVHISAVSQVGGTSIKTLQRHYDIDDQQAIEDVSKAITIPFGKERKKS